MAEYFLPLIHFSKPAVLFLNTISSFSFKRKQTKIQHCCFLPLHLRRRSSSFDPPIPSCTCSQCLPFLRILLPVGPVPCHTDLLVLPSLQQSSYLPHVFLPSVGSSFPAAPRNHFIANAKKAKTYHRLSMVQLVALGFIPN